MKKQQVSQVICEDGLVAIVRGDFSLVEQQAIGEALLAGGVRILEVTLNTKDALTGIRHLSANFPKLLVGAGTVRSAKDAEKALEAGANFLVSPNFDAETVAVAHAADTFLLPGVFTATEAQAAYRAGCSVVKLFPADALGPGYLKALRAPLNDVGFVPTGGVDPETIGAFHNAGAVAFGIGSYLIRNVAITAAEGDALQARAVALRLALAQARSA